MIAVIKLTSVSDTGKYCGFLLQWQVNHGEESNVEFSFPHKSLTRFSSFLGLIDINFTRKILTLRFAFG